MSPAPTPTNLPVELCLLGREVSGVDDAAGALRLLAERAVAHGYAHASYVDAVLEREVDFPTGLPLPVPVAIPHTDARHVARSALAALVPARPLRFGEMGGKDRTVDAELVVMLLVDDPAQQVGLLGRLITALRGDDLRERLLECTVTPQQLADRFAVLLDSPSPG